MKKVLISLIIGVLIISLVFSVYAEDRSENNSSSKHSGFGVSSKYNKSLEESKKLNKNLEEKKNKTNNGIGQELREQIRERKEEFKEGNYTGPQGRFMQVKILSKELREIRSGNHSTKTKLNMTIEYDSNETILRVILKNGSEKEIKIMPDTAVKKALDKLKLKVCNDSNNCTIELREILFRNRIRIGYELQVQRHSRIFGFSKTRFLEKIQIDAETGEIISSKKSWMSYISKKDD